MMLGFFCLFVLFVVVFFLGGGGGGSQVSGNPYFLFNAHQQWSFFARDRVIPDQVIA